MAKNPENFEKIYSSKVGQILHFICCPNARYMLGRETIRRSRYYYAPTTTLLLTRRGRNRAQHVRDCEADVEGAKNWRLMHLRRRFIRNQHVILSSTVLFRAIAFQQTVLLLVCNGSKSLEMSDFLKTGRRNMAETCAINFLTLVSYSTYIVIGCLRRLLLPVLM